MGRRKRRPYRRKERRIEEERRVEGASVATRRHLPDRGFRGLKPTASNRDLATRGGTLVNQCEAGGHLTYARRDAV